MKRCPRCRERKPLDAFGLDRNRRDGHSCYCRPCKREMARTDNARRHEAKKEWQRNFDSSPAGRLPCPRCGKPMGAGSVSNRNQRKNELCATCRHDEYDRKARKVVRLWAEGKTYPEIQGEMGWSSGMLSVMMSRYRADGYELPYRYRGQRSGTKFPAMRKAA